MPGLGILWGKFLDCLADPAPLPEDVMSRAVAPMPAAVDVDRVIPHFRFVRTGNDTDTVASDVAHGLDPVVRNRIVRGGDMNCVILEILDTASDPSTFTPVTGWDEDFITDIVNAVLDREFPSVIADDNDIDYASMFAAALHAAVVAAGLPFDRGMFDRMFTDVLRAAQRDVAS